MVWYDLWPWLYSTCKCVQTDTRLHPVRGTEHTTPLANFAIWYSLTYCSIMLMGIWGSTQRPDQREYGQLYTTGWQHGASCQIRCMRRKTYQRTTYPYIYSYVYINVHLCSLIVVKKYLHCLCIVKQSEIYVLLTLLINYSLPLWYCRKVSTYIWFNIKW